MDSTDLSQAIDVYSEWIDACEDVKDSSTTAAYAPPSSFRPSTQLPASAARASQNEKYADDGDGFVEDDEPDAEADYAEE